jgi:lipopolysaccharide/colanic/teichoic acid biosynthesis glycosyltransferase
MLQKRIFDIIFSSIGLILLAPLFIVIAVLIKVDSKGEVFFRQVRVGKNEVPFKIYKFRTMASKQKGSELKITIGNDRRITNIGKTLRKYKIDELPQLINILKGEMSFVGPRPEVQEYVKHYSKQNRDTVLSVRPGITDIASIEFKDENTILAKEADPEKAYIEKILPKKLRYCRFYVNNQSLCYDVFIILQTLKAVVSR